MCCETQESLSWLSLQWVFSPNTPEVWHKKNITWCFLSFSLGKVVCQWRERWWISRHCFLPFPLLPISTGKPAINWSARCYWGQNSNQGGGKDPCEQHRLIYVLQQDPIKSHGNSFVPVLSWGSRENPGLGFFASVNVSFRKCLCHLMWPKDWNLLYFVWKMENCDPIILKSAFSLQE